MTELSAALTIVQWAYEHGRNPRCDECRGASGLLWWTTYYKRFGVSTFSAVLANAYALASGAWNPPYLSQERRKKKCLNCSTMILDEGKHIRMCYVCRKRNMTIASDTDTSLSESSYYQQRLLKQYNIQNNWLETLIDWSEPVRK